MIDTYEKNNRGKLLAVILALAMVIVGAAVLIGDNGVDAATNTQNYSGDLDKVQEFPEGTNVIVNDRLTITSGGIMVVHGNLTVNSGVTVTVENGGMLIVDGGLVTVNGIINVTGSGSQFSVSIPTSNEITTGNLEEYKNYGVIVNGTVTITREAVMNNDYYDETADSDGDTPASQNGDGMVLVNNNGTLNVTGTGSRIATISNMNVDLAVGGTFNLDGWTDSNGMTVSTYGTGTIYSLASATISGGTNEGNTSSDITFTASSSVSTVWYFTNGAQEPSSTSMRDYALNVTGNLRNGQTIVFESSVENDNDEITPQYRYFFTSEDAAKRGMATGAFVEAGTSSGVYVPTYAHEYNDFVFGKVIISDLRAAIGTATYNGDSETVVTNEDTNYATNPAYVIINGTFTLDIKGNNDTSPDATFITYGPVELNGPMTGATPSTPNTQVGVIKVNGSLTIRNFDFANVPSVIGAGYLVENSDVEDMIVSGDLQATIDAAVAAEVEDVYVLGGYKSGQAGADGVGSFVLSSDVTVPANVFLNLSGGLYVPEGRTLTITADAAFVPSEGDPQYTMIWVDGKVVDYDTISEGEALQYIDFEVMSTVEDGDNIINTYTSFAIAIAETESGTITLYNDIEIDRNTEIRSGVTVQFADNMISGATRTITFSNEGEYTLTINGILNLGANGTINDANGIVAVNNYIVYTGDTDTQIVDADNSIDGAFFRADLNDDIAEAENYLSSVAFAAENSTSVENNVITIQGNVAMGDVTFTCGEDAGTLSVNLTNGGDDDRATGNVTLVGNVTFDTSNGNFDGTVSSETSAGTTTVQIDSNDVVVHIGSTETVDGTQTMMYVHGTSHADGTVAVTSGVVTIDEAGSFGKLSVSSGAEVIIEEGVDFTTGVNPDYRFNTTPTTLPLLTDSLMNNVAGLVVDGTLTVEGSITSYVAVINGTVNINQGTSTFYVAGVDGTLNAADNARIALMIAMIDGTLSGDVSVDGAVAAYPGSNVADADMTILTSGADVLSTNFHLNGAEYATVYAKEDVAIYSILLITDISGVQIDTSKFYIDEGMTDCIIDMTENATGSGRNADLQLLYNIVNAVRACDGTTASIADIMEDVRALYGASVDYAIGDYTDIYIGMDASFVEGTVSAGTGLDMYIDNIKWDEAHPMYYTGLTVGEHTVSFSVRAGYDGANATITFNGQTVENGGTIEISENGFVLLASGAVPSSGQVVVDNGGSDMGLTDYLLIILVVLIVIMAIMVAMRLMRS